MKIKHSENISQLKALLDYAWQKYHIQHNYFSSLDSKSSTITTFIGILFTVITGFVYYILTTEFIKSIKVGDCLNIIFLILLTLLLVSISATFYFSLSALAVKKIVDPSKIENVKKYLKSIEQTDKQSHRKLLIYIINSLSDSEKSVRETNFQKSAKVKLTTLLLKISLFLVLVNIVLYSFITIYK